MEPKKHSVSFDDLVSETSNGLSMDKNQEQEIIKKYLDQKNHILSETKISPEKQDAPEILKEIFFNQKHNGKTLEIKGLDEQKQISDQLTKELKPISDIFNLARDILGRSQRLNLKENFYNKEEIQIKNETQVAKALFFSTCITFLLAATFFALFKNRIIMIASVFTMAGAILSGLLFVNKKEKFINFSLKKYALLDDDINEIKIRLRRIRDDVSFYAAINKVQHIPNFEIEFSTKINHVLDLIVEYEHIEKTDFDKRYRYYKEILKNFDEMVKYEKTTYDKYFFEKMKVY